MANKKSQRKNATLAFGALGGGFIPAGVESFRQNREGAMQGAVTGAGIGAAGGPFGALAGASIGLIAGGFGAFGSRRQAAPQLDIASLMAQINARIAAAGELAKKQTIARAGRQRRGIASNLASRGILRSGASENVFGEQRRNVEESLAGIDQQVLEEQARSSASLLGQGAQIQNKQARADAEAANRRQAARMGQLGALASSLLNNRLQAASGKKLNPGTRDPFRASNNELIFPSTGGAGGRSQNVPLFPQGTQEGPQEFLIGPRQ